MKKVIFTILAACTISITQAKIHVVSNLFGVTTDFTNLTDATNAAQNGDSIYIQPSPIAYAGFQYLDKKLHFFGNGFKPSKDMALQTIITGSMNVGDQTNIPGTPTGSTFEGIIFRACRITFSYSFQTSGPINNISFRRCEFRTEGNFTTINIGGISNAAFGNYNFESCYFNNTEINGRSDCSYSNFLIRNCYFRENINSRNFFDFQNASSMVVDHCLFYNHTPRGLSLNLRFFLFTNNIFYNVNIPSALFSTFNNNLNFGGTATPWALTDNIDGGGNVDGQSPQLADQAAMTANANGANNPVLDFSIAAGPANNSGSDGKDMGLLFDSNAATNWAFARNALLPLVKRMNILNPTITPNGTLNVQLSAQAAQ